VAGTERVWGAERWRGAGTETIIRCAGGVHGSFAFQADQYRRQWAPDRGHTEEWLLQAFTIDVLAGCATSGVVVVYLFEVQGRASGEASGQGYSRGCFQE